MSTFVNLVITLSEYETCLNFYVFTYVYKSLFTFVCILCR